MKTALIVANGKKNSKEFIEKLAKKADFIIGVDRGAEYLINFGIKIDAAIGDFDSIDKKMFSEIKKKNILIKKFPRKKDYSDTELAVRFAIEKGIKNFILTGMLGKRLDHTLFNISVLLFLTKKGCKGKIIEENEEIYITKEKLHLKVNIEDTISIFPITSTATILSTKGLQYPISHRTIRNNSTLTLSNKSIAKNIMVEVGRGTILIIREKI